MGTTPDLPVAPAVLPAAEAAPPGMAGGDSDVVLLCARLDVGVVMEIWATEFLREDFFDERDAPTARLLALLRFRFLMTSVFNDNGRTTPCSLRNRPQALQRG